MAQTINQMYMLMSVANRIKISVDSIKEQLSRTMQECIELLQQNQPTTTAEVKPTQKEQTSEDKQDYAQNVADSLTVGVKMMLKYMHKNNSPLLARKISVDLGRTDIFSKLHYYGQICNNKLVRVYGSKQGKNTYVLTDLGKEIAKIV
jgi:hypothetical protein